MRLLMKVLLCLLLLPAGASGQEQIRKVLAGPFEGQFRVVIAFMEPAEDSYMLQSMIIDMKRDKKDKEQPVSFQLDLTSTVRSIETGAKKQRILLLRWKQPGELELRCDGKWRKQEAGTKLDQIVEATRLIMQNVPLLAKKATEVTLPPEVEQKVAATLNALGMEDFRCLRSSN